jgi:ketosteroid isomerase-like protein
MSNYVYDNATLLSMLLGLTALTLLALWWRTRRWTLALGGGITVGLIGLVWLLASFSDQRRLERTVEDMAAAVEAKDLDRILKHVAEDFHFQSTNKASLRKNMADTINSGNLTAAKVWDFEIVELSHETHTAKIAFKVKPVGNWGSSTQFFRCEALMGIDPDGEFRMKTFQIFNPFVETRSTPLSVPGY